MKNRLQRYLFFVFLLLGSNITLRAQQRIQKHRRPANIIFRKIDRAYRDGMLTLDQRIRYKFYAETNPKRLPAAFQSEEDFPIKCGTPAIMDFHVHRSQLSPATIQEVESLTGDDTRLQSSETYVSPSGKFLIHYETSGEDSVSARDSDNNGVPDYVDEVAAAADSSYRHEIQNLGYPDPIPNGEQYDVEILNLKFIYGQTYIANNTTRIQIENDFSEGFPTNTDPEGDQIGAIKVTMAHELKHAINYTINNWTGETTRWGEMDATLEEDIVYDNVNDYYNYLENDDSIFNSPQVSFYPGSYYHVTWAIFFEQQYGSQFWPQVWDIIGNDPENITMIEALSNQLGDENAFVRAYILSQLWHYASGNQNAIGDFGFEEKGNYPNPTINEQLVGIDSLNSPVQIPRLAANYAELRPSIPNDGFLRLDFSFSKEMSGVGLIAEFNDGSYKVLTSLTTDTTSQKTIQTDWKWDDIIRVGIVAANSSDINSANYTVKTYPSIPEQITLQQNYPNPFNPETKIQFSLTDKTNVRLRVFDITGRLVKTLRNETYPPGYYEVPFDGANLASGVYIYQLITDQKTISRKMTLIK